MGQFSIERACKLETYLIIMFQMEQYGFAAL